MFTKLFKLYSNLGTCYTSYINWLAADARNGSPI